MHWKNIKAFLSPILVAFQKSIAVQSFDLDKLWILPCKSNLFSLIKFTEYKIFVSLKCSYITVWIYISLKSYRFKLHICYQLGSTRQPFLSSMELHSSDYPQCQELNQWSPIMRVNALPDHEALIESSIILATITPHSIVLGKYLPYTRHV